MTESMRIYTALKRDIVLCEVKPGASVSEAELCSRYNTGRTPVREACRRLHEEALLQIVPFRGYFIMPLTIQEYRNLNEAQLVIEPATAALAAERATESQIKRIERLAEYEYYPGMKTSYSTFLERNYSLHTEIAAASGNLVFEETIANLHTRLMRYFYLVISMDSYGQELVEEHRELARAIRQREPDLARKKAAEHQQRTIERSAKLSLGSVNLQPSDSASGSFVRHASRRPAVSRVRTAAGI